AEDVAHREHAERADALLACHRQQAPARVLMHHAEAQHEHFPDALLHRASEHGVLGVARAGLGHREVAELALLLLAQQPRHDLRHGLVVGRRPQPVQVEDVDVVGVELAQRVVEIGEHGGAGRGVALGRDDDAVARAALDGLADDALRLVGRGGVEEVDAEVERLAHERHRLRLGQARAQPDAAVAAAAQARNADLQAGLAERGVVHRLPPRDAIRVARNLAQAAGWVKRSADPTPFVLSACVGSALTLDPTYDGNPIAFWRMSWPTDRPRRGAAEWWRAGSGRGA